MINYQNVVDFTTQLFYIAGPIAIVFVIVEKSTNMLISFIRGDRRVNL